MTSFSADIGHRELTFSDRVRGINWGLILLVSAISGIGFAMLYLRRQRQFWQPWASKQVARFALAFIPMIAAALIDIRYWYRIAYWVFGLALLLVIAVDLRGVIGMGAQRWIDLKIYPAAALGAADEDRAGPRAGALFFTACRRRIPGGSSISSRPAAMSHGAGRCWCLSSPIWAPR